MLAVFVVTRQESPHFSSLLHLLPRLGNVLHQGNVCVLRGAGLPHLHLGLLQGKVGAEGKEKECLLFMWGKGDFLDDHEVDDGVTTPLPFVVGGGAEDVDEGG